MPAEHIPDRRSRQTVQVMHAHGIPHRIIAKVIECDPKTLRKHYRQELNDASWEVEAAMGAAIVSAGQNGAWGAAKYWLVTHAKDPQWRTPEPHSISGNPDMPPLRIQLADMTDDDLRKELAELRDRTRAADGARTLVSQVPSRSNGVDH